MVWGGRRADPSQKLFFRFSCIYGQDFPVDPLYSYVQVEFNVGRRSTCTLPQKMADTGLFPFLQVQFAPRKHRYTLACALKRECAVRRASMFTPGLCFRWHPLDGPSSHGVPPTFFLPTSALPLTFPHLFQVAFHRP